MSVRKAELAFICDILETQPHHESHPPTTNMGDRSPSSPRLLAHQLSGSAAGLGAAGGGVSSVGGVDPIGRQLGKGLGWIGEKSMDEHIALLEE